MAKIPALQKLTHMCSDSFPLSSIIHSSFAFPGFLQYRLSLKEWINVKAWTAVNQICQLEQRFFSSLSDGFLFFDSFLWMIHEKEEMRHNAERTISNSLLQKRGNNQTNCNPLPGEIKRYDIMMFDGCACALDGVKKLNIVRYQQTNGDFRRRLWIPNK